MKLLFVWTGITGYMADCWRELAKLPDVQVKVLIAEKQSSERAFERERVLRELDCWVVDDDAPIPAQAVVEAIKAFQPDVIAVVGWHNRLCRFVAESNEFRTVPKILMSDMPFEWRLRKFVAPLVLHPYLRRFALAYVNGERAARYARWLGFNWVEKGLIGFDAERLKDVWEKRKAAGGRQRRFLFVGRYAETKRLDVLIKAYCRYRAQVGSPWPLDCFGAGPCGRFLKKVEGVKDNGFLQPDGLADVLAAHDVFVLTSDHEPWSVAIGEACASGMPVICTKACGAVEELVGNGENGFICPTNDVEAIARAMVWMQMHEGGIPAMGKNGMALTTPYSCKAWAERTRGICKRTISGEG